MLATILSFVATVLAGLAKSWFSQNAATTTAIQLGASQQALASESQANAVIQTAQIARAGFVPYTAASLSALKPGSDSNFRD